MYWRHLLAITWGYRHHQLQTKAQNNKKKKNTTQTHSHKRLNVECYLISMTFCSGSSSKPLNLWRNEPFSSWHQLTGCWPDFASCSFSDFSVSRDSEETRLSCFVSFLLQSHNHTGGSCVSVETGPPEGLSGELTRDARASCVELGDEL